MQAVMRLSEGVEWAAHAAAVLAALPDDRALPAEALARYHDLPPAYLAKHMQLLRRAGVVASSRGAGGGYWLARAPSNITLLQIADAIEGGGPFFECMEIRKKGACPARPEQCRVACPIAAAFHVADAAWRASLARVTLADITASVASLYTMSDVGRFGAWLSANMTARPKQKSATPRRRAVQKAKPGS